MDDVEESRLWRRDPYFGEDFASGTFPFSLCSSTGCRKANHVTVGVEITQLTALGYPAKGDPATSAIHSPAAGPARSRFEP
jgi:hypothetical protein